MCVRRVISVRTELDIQQSSSVQVVLSGIKHTDKSLKIVSRVFLDNIVRKQECRIRLDHVHPDSFVYADQKVVLHLSMITSHPEIVSVQAT